MLAGRAKSLVKENLELKNQINEEIRNIVKNVDPTDGKKEEVKEKVKYVNNTSTVYSAIE